MYAFIVVPYSVLVILSWLSEQLGELWDWLWKSSVVDYLAVGVIKGGTK